jgi:hypothetical protein
VECISASGRDDQVVVVCGTIIFVRSQMGQNLHTSKNVEVEAPAAVSKAG